MVKNRIYIPVIIIQILLLLACKSFSTIIPSTDDQLNPGLGKIKTATLSSTLSYTSTPASTPSLTPAPTLADQGPYLLYDKYRGDGPLILTDTGYQNQKKLYLPDGVYIYDLRHAVSPDGKWLAFYSGTYEEPYDISLNLMAIPDGSITPISRLLSPEYPGNLEFVFDYYTQQGYEFDGMDYSVKLTFNWAISRIFEWSPDGRFLAFAGQLDGPSSDLYIYNVQTGDIRRLTDDLRILTNLTWSPNGDWLLYENLLPGWNYNGATLHRIPVDGSVAMNPPILEEGYWWSGIEWISPDLFLLTGQGDGGDPYDLRLIDIESGMMRDVWPEAYLSYAFDPLSQTFAINGFDGVFLISLIERTRRSIEGIDWIIGSVGISEHQFVGSNKGEVVFVLDDGTFIKTDLKFTPSDILVSPDQDWFILFDQGYGRVPLTLVSSSGKSHRILSDLEVQAAVWRNDAPELIYANNDKLFHIKIPEGKPDIIDQCASDDKNCNFSSRYLVWLP